jgi:hypothetical protein
MGVVINLHAFKLLPAPGAEAGLELILGGPLSGGRDYKLTNDAGTFKLMTNTDNFETAGDELFQINSAGEIGIGTSLPTSRLHIDGGEEASNSGDGYMILGGKASTNIVFDANEIIARNNGNASTLNFQLHDGNTYIGNGGGNTYIGGSTSNLGIGTTSPDSPLSIRNDNFQLKLQNSTGQNDWYIGASNLSWTAGDNQLLFSPDQTSDAAALRLFYVTENGGTVAPVIIKSSANQSLLLDGDEIDTKSGPLYFNYNSNQETYLNPSGGRVGIGTSDPSTTIQVKTQDDEVALRLQLGTSAWDINPMPAFDYLGFVKDAYTVGRVDGASGQWITISDRRFKQDIEDLTDVMDKLKKINVYSYSFKYDTTHTRQIGVIAQEIAAEFPEVVSINDGTYAVAYSKLSVIILKALQEQQRKSMLSNKKSPSLQHLTQNKNRFYVSNIFLINFNSILKI